MHLNPKEKDSKNAEIRRFNKLAEDYNAKMRILLHAKAKSVFGKQVKEDYQTIGKELQDLVKLVFGEWPQDLKELCGVRGAPNWNAILTKDSDTIRGFHLLRRIS
jgi:hypothetical protein